MIFNLVSGGSLFGGKANFKIINGTIEPNSPRENTIWVQSDTDITGWEFINSTTPSVESEGFVSIYSKCGDGSESVDFNVLSKNGIWLRPIEAKQYVNGAWVITPAKIYKNSEWADLHTYLYYYNQQAMEWEAKGTTWVTGWAAKAPTVTYNDDGSVKVSLRCALSTDSTPGYEEFGEMTSGVFCAVDEFDMTNYSRISVTCADVYVDSTAASGISFAIWKGDAPSQGSVSRSLVGLVKNGTADVDVTGLEGPHNVGILITHNPYNVNETRPVLNGYATITEITPHFE